MCMGQTLGGVPSAEAVMKGPQEESSEERDRRDLTQRWGHWQHPWKFPASGPLPQSLVTGLEGWGDQQLPLGSSGGALTQPPMWSMSRAQSPFAPPILRGQQGKGSGPGAAGIGG